MAVTAGNNVSFLIGSQSKVNELLAATSGIQAGAFYVTNDTNRLYFGADATKLVALNQGVQTVGTTAQLTDPEAGQFYYVADQNVLCVYNGKNWVQINPDNNTTNASMATAITTAENTSTVQTTVTDSASKSVSSSFVLKGQNLTITSEGTTITLTGDVYSMTTEAGKINLTKNDAVVATANIVAADATVAIGGDTNGITIAGNKVNSVGGTADADGNLTMTVNQARGGSVSGSFKLTAQGGVSIAKGAGANELIIASETYELDAEDATDGVAIKLTGTKGASASVTMVKGDNIKKLAIEEGNIAIDSKDSYVSGLSQTANAEGGFTITAAQTEGRASASVTIDPQIKYGAAGTETVKFKDGVATLSVYTKAEVDDALLKAGQTQDAMRFAGVVKGAEEINTALGKGIANGDTFKVSGSFNLTIGGEVVTLKTGDLLIATGTEVDNIIPAENVEWQYIPSGDDVDNYEGKVIEHGLQIVRKATTDQVVGSLALEAGDGITLTDAGSGQTRTVSVALTAVNGSTTTEEAATQAGKGSLKFNAVTGVEYDKYGRVSEVKTKEITVVDTHNSLTGNSFTAAVDSGVATVSNTVTMSDGESKTGTFSIKSNSSNLQLTASGSQITMNLVWGTF